MSDPTTAPFSSVRLADVVTDSGPPDGSGAAAFHLVRRHFDVQAFGVNGATGNAGELVITEHDERADTDYGTEGHEELFTVISGHAVFTIVGGCNRGRHRDPRRGSASGRTVCRLALGTVDRLTRRQFVAHGRLDRWPIS